MVPRVPSQAAQRGQSPVASVGLRLGAPPQPPRSSIAANESDADADEGAQAKAHQNQLLDEAIEESFPASDPASPFVAAKTQGAQAANAPFKDQGDAIDSME